ncbi:MAG TPA: DUF2955 domain-containing protein [Allosphingosinicella sp.]|jgi:hypothetical protein
MIPDPVDLARKHAKMRFATGITLAFVLAEAMGWFPSFLPAVLLAVLLTSLPASPPLKVGVVLVLVMTAAATLAYAIPYLLRGTPSVMVGVIGLVIFAAFLASARGIAKLPALLLLLCLVTIPVVVMIIPDQAVALRTAMGRSMAIAMLVLWLMFALWPRVVPPAPPAAGTPIVTPVRKAVGGTFVLMPMIVVYLMYGLTDALPVLVTTMMLLLNFDPCRGAKQGVAMMAGNVVGGGLGALAFLLVGVAPSLVTLGLIVFLVAMWFAVHIDKGGAYGAIGLIAANTSLIILSSALGSPASSSGIWLTRLVQFLLACLFAIGMMALIWGKKESAGQKLAGSNA